MNRARPWLLPLVPLYRLGLALDALHANEPQRLQWPVISVGNLSTGGAGKTPLTIALAKALTARGLHVDVLSRGYGRTSKLPARVDPAGTAEAFGDEPLVIARHAGVPVYIADERYEAGLLAEFEHASSALKRHDFSRAESLCREPGALAPEGYLSGPNPISLHLLDDGFQHRRLARDVNILMMNRSDWNDGLLPAGNLREPLKAAHRATVMAIPADDPALASELRAWGWRRPVWLLHRRMDVPQIHGPVAAFCGIARPQQFFDGLEAAGLQVASRTSFPDHHRYVQHDLDCLLDAARNVNAAAFLTTEKDRARLGVLAATFPQSIPLRVADLLVEMEGEATAIDWLIAQCSPTP